MKIKCRFILVHDLDNDPLIINPDHILKMGFNGEENNYVAFNNEDNIFVTESTPKVAKIIRECSVIEIEEFIALHDEWNNHLFIKVSEISNIFMMPKDNAAKSKVYLNDGNFVYVKENVNKIYSLLTQPTQEKPNKKDD